jgi:hypothetical protein
MRIEERLVLEVERVADGRDDRDGGTLISTSPGK